MSEIDFGIKLAIGLAAGAVCIYVVMFLIAYSLRNVIARWFFR